MNLVDSLYFCISVLILSDCVWIFRLLSNYQCFLFLFRSKKKKNVAKMKLYQKYYKVQSFIIIDCNIYVNI